MANITYVEHNGTAHVIDVADGFSLMEGAVSNSVPGIDGDCGGNCACATCHVYVDAQWTGVTGERSEMESAMLEFAENVTDNSRLCCQITASPALEGLVVRMPVAQH